ncbi:polygalacturonate 4-alpha-galacturonosyltransferase isoform X1 [Cryptomeria japonica]|uniref:polygalacturonate 4-alpha-galacturonosyltransferase isoform X1 n=1 Tax=Cryptomeria japonica TaxID=3369 RepID=UPI0025AC526E|nr:polygalacturonate 4-alpha-galacturonosyltransferase isoform X1 [Cryptomeria japonica]
MALKKGSFIHNRVRNSKNRVPVVSLLVISVVVPLLFFASWGGKSKPIRGNKNLLQKQLQTGDWRKLTAIEEIEDLFPEEVIEVIKAHTHDDSGPLNLNRVGQKDLSSSWVWENPTDIISNGEKQSYQQRQRTDNDEQDTISGQSGVYSKKEVEQNSEGVKQNSLEQENSLNDESLANAIANYSIGDNPAKLQRRKLRQQRREKRVADLIRQDEEETINLENSAITRSKAVDSAYLGKYSIWRREYENDNLDSTIKLIRDQILMARVYASIARSRNSVAIYDELMKRSKESRHVLGEARLDSELHHSAPEKIKGMGQVLSRAREKLYDCATVTKKLRAMLQSAEQQVRTLKKQSTFLSQLAAKTIPKGVNCLSMRLTIDYYLLPLEERDFPNQDKLEDPNLYHYALFSDNVLAVSVVVNSTILNAKEPEKHVFHLVTDRLNFGAIKMWFLNNPPGKATIHVENVDDFKWLNSSYCPVLRQLESAAMKEYYFKAENPTTLAAGFSNLKYRNPKYLSMLNHLRFYLPQVFPKLDKILFLDDDIVVQKDLAPLWSVDLQGKVNGAVETCGESFHRYDKYLNFSNPHIARNFDPNACGWAYGMNLFDLKEWKKRDITGIYHKWQDMNEDRVLWKLGTLPPGLITFYNLTHPLNSNWHVLGLGYNPTVEISDIENAAVVHYNGNMKPWLEIAMIKYRPYWTRYVKYDHPYLQQCNINE